MENYHRTPGKYTWRKKQKYYNILDIIYFR